MKFLTLSALSLAAVSFGASQTQLLETSAIAQDCQKKSTCCASSPAAMLVANPGEKTIVETAVEAGNFRTLVAAVEAAGLARTLSGEGPFTVFAPSDDAFAALPEGTLEELLKPENKDTLAAILTYHVVEGSVMAKDVVTLTKATTVNGQRANITVDKETRTVMIGDAKVTTTDIECSNGVIHVIDSVMMPATADIVQTAVDAGSFRTLAAAIKAAGLVETLKGKGPFTVFAPTDEAFAALPEGTLQELLKPESKDRLTNILMAHVVSGRVFSDQALEAGMAKTLQGSSVEIKKEGDVVMIGAAKLITADVQSSNGVIHVIDSVILPKN